MTRHLLKLVWNRKRANALILLEIFLSFLVVFTVVTLAGSLIGRWRDPLGFDWQNVWVIGVDTGKSDDMTVDEASRERMERLVRETRSFAEVEAAAVAVTPPYSLSTNEGIWIVEGRRIRLLRDNVSDGFADVMKMKVIRGRWFRAEDDALAFTPVVIGSDLAAAIFGDEDPIGKKFDDVGETELRVVGVVPPYRKDGELSAPNTNMAFVRASLTAPRGRVPHDLVIRVRPGTGAEFEERLTARLHELAPDVRFTVRRMERMRKFLLRLRVTPIAIGVVVAAFLIAMVALGLTGVLWQNVTRRTRELGLRRAIGATGAAVRRQILAEVALLATLAMIVGVAVAVQLPLVGAFSFVSTRVFAMGLAIALAVIYAITLLCGLYPSWLASRLEPADALRYE